MFMTNELLVLHAEEVVAGIIPLPEDVNAPDVESIVSTHMSSAIPEGALSTEERQEVAAVAIADLLTPKTTFPQSAVNR